MSTKKYAYGLSAWLLLGCSTPELRPAPILLQCEKCPESSSSPLQAFGFLPTEATLEENSDQLTLRLTGLHFPVNQAALSTESLGLLSRVADFVRARGGGPTIVKAFTDSAGGREWNERLSLRRGRAVSTYLVAVGAVDPRHLETRGMGPVDPLASDITELGRMANRRVEIILEKVPTSFD